MTLHITITSHAFQKLYNLINSMDGDTWALKRLWLKDTPTTLCYLYFGRNAKRIRRRLQYKDWCTDVVTQGY